MYSYAIFLREAGKDLFHCLYRYLSHQRHRSAVLYNPATLDRGKARRTVTLLHTSPRFRRL